MFKLVDELINEGAKIKVCGVGGGGGNALNTMISSDLKGVEFIAANTDLQALNSNKAPIKLQLGSDLTSGLGAGANPEIGQQAAIESEAEITEILKGADMVFVTAGMGGGTGTGSAPVLARIAKDIGALTVGVVTKPFGFEGKRRSLFAEEGLKNLQESVDTLITIPNDRLLHLAGQEMTMVDAFRRADDVLLFAVRGIADLITVHGLINLDFADVRTVMSEMGMALMGTGVANGENRAVEAATRAISSPLLENVQVTGATGILINICGGPDLTLFEVNEAARLIQEEADENANILFGSVIDPSLGDQIRVTVIATGFNKKRTARSPHMERSTASIAPIQPARPTEAPSLRLQEVEAPAQAVAKEVVPERPASQQVDLNRLVQEIGFSGSGGGGQVGEPDQYDIPTFLRKHAD